jgi:hypothetical protein
LAWLDRQKKPQPKPAEPLEAKASQRTDKPKSVDYKFEFDENMRVRLSPRDAATAPWEEKE